MKVKKKEVENTFEIGLVYSLVLSQESFLNLVNNIMSDLSGVIFGKFCLVNNITSDLGGEIFGKSRLNLFTTHYFIY